MKTLKQATINYKRALTRHQNEQLKGLTNMSCQQTRRMYLAVQALQRASFELTDAKRHANS